MSDPEWSGPSDLPDHDRQARGDDGSRRRYRARHGDAAPAAYPRTASPAEPGTAVGAGTAPLPARPENPLPVRPETEPPSEAAGALPLWPDRAVPGVNGGADDSGEPGASSEPGSPSEHGADTGGGAAAVAAGGTGRAGRNLPAAIAVGVSLAAAAVVPLFLWPPAFVVVVMVAGAVATWEMVRAIRATGANPPLVPLILGGVAMAGLAWIGGAEALTLGLAATTVASLVWRLSDGPAGYQRDAGAAVLIAVYVPFLAGFAVLLAQPPDGAKRVIATLAAVVLSDTGGYIAGVFLGRHPMAPSVSPKKSWEGLAGSLVAAGTGSAVLLHVLLQVAWWWGLLFGLAIAAAAVLGDLAESLFKRDLGIKDMSTLLPGHGGLMDRLDSILFAAPTGYAVLAIVAPATG